MDTAIAYEKVRRIIDEMNLDAILITDRYNMRYIASYRGEGVIVLAGSGKTVITDSRYTEQWSSASAKDMNVRILLEKDMLRVFHLFLMDREKILGILELDLRILASAIESIRNIRQEYSVWNG